MRRQIPMTRSERFLLDTTRSLKSLSSSTPWLTLHSPYLPRIRDMDVSGCSTFSPSISPCHRYSRDPRIGRTNGHSICIVLWIEYDWYHSKSPSNSCVFIVGAILRSEDCQPEQQSVHHDNHWWSHDRLLSISRRQLHINDNPIRSIDIGVQGFEWFEHHIIRQSDTKNHNDLARNANYRFCDFIGSQVAVQNHEVQAHQELVDDRDLYE